MSIGYTSSYEYLKKHYGEENAQEIIKSRNEEIKVVSQENQENVVSQTLIQNLIDAGLSDQKILNNSYFSSTSNHIDVESNQVRRILTNKRLFDQEKTNPNSILYPTLAFDLFELNGVDEKLIRNGVLRYSDKINEYYKQKFGRKLFDSKDTRSQQLTTIINSKEFQQYYRFGYHSLNASRHSLSINANLLKLFTKHIFDDQKQHSFDLSIKDVLASPNTYDLIDKTQRQQTFNINVNAPKKSKVR